MKPLYVQIKCELGRAYEVADALIDTLEETSEVYSTSGECPAIMTTRRSLSSSRAACRHSSRNSRRGCVVARASLDAGITCSTENSIQGRHARRFQ